MAPKELNHFNKLRSATITATLAPGYSLGRGARLPATEAGASCRPTIVYDYNGQSREFRQSSSGLYVIFLLALAFIYLVLAAQFESFGRPARSSC